MKSSYLSSISTQLGVIFESIYICRILNPISDINECSSNPCQNAGECTDRVNSFKCLCKPGFTGDVCEININECARDPCQNGGICIDGIDEFTCTCTGGYAGVLCERSKSSYQYDLSVKFSH